MKFGAMNAKSCYRRHIGGAVCGMVRLQLFADPIRLPWRPCCCLCHLTIEPDYCLRPDAISSGQVCHVSFVLRFQLAETSAPQRMAQIKTPSLRALAEVDGIKLYYLTADHEEIVEIEGRNTHKLELVTAA